MMVAPIRRRVTGWTKWGVLPRRWLHVLECKQRIVALIRRMRVMHVVGGRVVLPTCWFHASGHKQEMVASKRRAVKGWGNGVFCPNGGRKRLSASIDASPQCTHGHGLVKPYVWWGRYLHALRGQCTVGGAFYQLPIPDRVRGWHCVLSTIVVTSAVRSRRRAGCPRLVEQVAHEQHLMSLHVRGETSTKNETGQLSYTGTQQGVFRQDVPIPCLGGSIPFVGTSS